MMKTIDRFRTTWTWTILQEDVEYMSILHAKYGSTLLVVGRETDSELGTYTIRVINDRRIVDKQVRITCTGEVIEIETVVITE